MAHRGDHARFLLAFLRRPASVGSIVPSSPALARAMLDGVHPGPHEAVLEYGPGTGAFTAEIIKRLAGRANGTADLSRRYLGIELDAGFVRLLQRRFPQGRFVEASAEHADRHCRAAGLKRVAAVISSLPFASLPTGVQERVVRTLARLLPRGSHFRTYQYLHTYPLPSAGRFREMMRRALGPHRRTATVIRNVPPAFVLSWRKR